MDSNPRRERPVLPEGYGLPRDDAGLLTWAVVEQRLIESKHYWLATVRPDGRPHVVPRWGVWVDGRFYYDGSPMTRHARNAEANPATSLHLESGSEAVILDGLSVATRADSDGLGERLAAAFAKYHRDGYAPRADAWSGDGGGGLRCFTPTTGMAWFSFPTDATRFVFRQDAPTPK
jgi:hypothetical protein